MRISGRMRDVGVRISGLPLAILLLLFCSAGAAADQTVTVGPGLSFTPSTVIVAPGERVTWVWAGSPHSSTSDSPTGLEAWDSGVRSTGATFSHTFNTPGTYPYYCSVHSSPGGTAMNGVVQVIAATATPTSPPTPAPTATPGPGTAVPTLSPWTLALFALALAGIGFLLIQKHL